MIKHVLIRIMQIKKALQFSLLLTLFLFCTENNMSDEDKIVEVYADMMEAFGREDLKGIMNSIAEDFESSDEDLSTYDALKEARAEFLLSNSNVNLSYRNINISLADTKAEVNLRINLTTNEIETSWTQLDSLRKDRGKWKIFYWRRLSD